MYTLKDNNLGGRVYRLVLSFKLRPANQPIIMTVPFGTESLDAPGADYVKLLA